MEYCHVPYFIDESWEYHAKQKKSDENGQEPYDFTHVWNIIPKATKEQDELQLIDTDNGRVFQREKRKEIG